MMPNFTQAYLDSSYFMPTGWTPCVTREPPTTEHYHHLKQGTTNFGRWNRTVLIGRRGPILYKAALKKQTTTEEE